MRVECSFQIATKYLLGDCFTIGPSALSFLKHWPEMKKRNDEIKYKILGAFHKHTGERMKDPVEWPNTTHHLRPKFHGLLLEQAAKVGIEIEYGKEVIDFFESEETDQAGVILQDNSKISADLVVAADGLKSKSWQLIAGKPVPARSSGLAIFRVAYPVEIALADPMIAERFKLLPDGRSVMELWAGYECYFDNVDLPDADKLQS